MWCGTDMNKAEARCPSELTTVSAEALNDENILDIFLSLQKNATLLRIRLAIERVLQCKLCAMADEFRLTFDNSKG
jgi:hypothetical protein